MSVRARLFLLLLALSVLPILFLRLNARHYFGELSSDLVRRTQHLLVNKAKAHMRLMVEDHAELWRRETMFLEQTMRLQMAEVENAIEQRSERLPPDLAQAYKSSSAVAGMNIMGQITVFEDGSVVASNPDIQLPRHFDGRQARWYIAAKEHKGLVWTAPVTDPATRRMALTLSGPVRDPSGRLVGVTALMAPLTIGGLSKMHTADVSERMRTYLVDFGHPDAPANGLRVIGEADRKAEDAEPAGQAPGHGQAGARGHRMGMLGVTEPVWLSPDDPAMRQIILADLKNGLSEVRQAELTTKDTIWAYAPAGVEGLALVLTAPKTDVSADADLASAYIKTRIKEQFTTTFYILLGALAAITLVAWLVSRTVARPLSELAAASRRIGTGDFEARVTPAGGREIEEVGRAFNDMVPGLKERTRLMEAMRLAQEVHHRLLPADLPAIPGMDLAGTSIACAETGGDSFDVIARAHGCPTCTAALVGDVSGHGLDATLLMATARAFLRMRALQPGTPAQVVMDVNRFLARDTVGTGRFMTLFYLELDPGKKTLRFVRAGHDPALLYRAAEDDFEELSGPGIPLGVLEEREFEGASRPWPKPGDVLLIGSDGLWESRGPDGSMFGKERVRQALRQSAGLPAREILQALLAALDAFRAGEPAEDDVTLLILKAVQATEAS